MSQKWLLCLPIQMDKQKQTKKNLKTLSLNLLDSTAQNPSTSIKGSGNTVYWKYLYVEAAFE